ncbi:MAG: FprA family A-type flavoprotein [Candidatus Altiarchaeota archaeon]|nr:FprA family A-type flavoprotein [Candidatus Altiarchaeota archaeon]
MVWELAKNIYCIGSQDWDRRLFDELIPLPDGTSYNSYIINGSEKTALIDTVDPTKTTELIDNLRGLSIAKIDYVIPNHAEQDHSGSIPAVLSAYPGAKVVTNEKCKDFLIDLLHIEDSKFHVVKDGETLSLGDKTLEFILAPWVHWPETMLTYLREEKILFSCDLFGSHLATTERFVGVDAVVLKGAKRYYAEIMMPFRQMIRGHLKKLEGYDIRVIAASHGPVYDKPEFIVDAYRGWVSDDVKNEVVLVHISMHGSTQRMVDYFIGALSDRGVVVKPFNLSVTDIGELAMALVDAATVVLASPVVHVGPHPQMAYAAFLANALRPKTRFASVIGSYGWGQQLVERLAQLIPNLKVELLNPVIARGLPRESDFKELDRLADDISKKHKEHKLV